MNTKFFRMPVFGHFLRKIIIKKEGGEKQSATLREYCKKYRNTDIGMYTYGSCFSNDFNTGGKVTIGRYCSFGPNIRYFGANHPINMAVMSPYFYNKKFSGYDVKDVKRECLVIDNDVWIGANVVILSKCHHIGNGAVIGAGTIVTSDIPAYAIVVGNPGRIIRYRFEKDTIEKLNSSSWWEYSPDKLLSLYDSMEDPLLFANRIEDLK